MLKLTVNETRAVGLALAVKTTVSLAMLFFFFQFTDFNNPGGLNIRWYTGTENISSWWIPFANWDGQHYLLLADWGYNYGHDRTGGQQFYPLYPMLIRLLSVVLSPWVAGLLLNYLFVAGFCVLLYRLAVHYQCQRPLLVVLLMMTFPTAFFTSAIYSEPLFLFLQTGFFYHLLVTRSRAGLVYLAFLPLTRGTAVFILGGMLLYAGVEYARYRYALQQTRNQKQRAAKHGGGKAARRRSRTLRLRAPAHETETAAFEWRYYLECIAAFSLGVLGYLLFFQIAVGDPLAGIKAQEVIGAGNRIGNLFNPLNFLNNLFRPVHDWGNWFSIPSPFDRITLVLLLAAVFLFLARKEWVLLCFYFPIIYAHAAMGIGTVSYARYVLLAVPFLALALVKHVPRPAPLYALCAFTFVVQLYLAYRFSLSLWAG